MFSCKPMLKSTLFSQAFKHVQLLMGLKLSVYLSKALENQQFSWPSVYGIRYIDAFKVFGMCTVEPEVMYDIPESKQQFPITG